MLIGAQGLDFIRGKFDTVVRQIWWAAIQFLYIREPFDEGKLVMNLSAGRHGTLFGFCEFTIGRTVFQGDLRMLIDYR